ncbi:MAG TPA: endo alpha-1,4 polygalactosaminidase [Nannocystis exedens]|nr:endo alpha-1,4 polygalactosaminidase [Nannocystis exedens]
MHPGWIVALWVVPTLFVGACTPERGPAEHLDVDVPADNDGDHYRPGVDTRWQWQLSGAPINLGYAVDLYDIDLFERQGDIASIQAAGFKVICYFSAGSAEDWREDFDRFAAADLGKNLDGWAGERWLDIRSPEVWQIMMDRLDLAAAVGCDGVEPDNVEAFNNDSGFSLTADDQLAYNRGLANAAHQRGLSIGLKNDGVQVRELVDYYDFCVNEECNQYEECGQYQPFLDAGKPVFNAEYTESDDLAGAQAWGASICASARAMGLRTLILPLELDDAFRVSCDEEF